MADLLCLAAIVEWCRGVAAACQQYITPCVLCPIRYFRNRVAAWGVWPSGPTADHHNAWTSR